MRSTAPVAAAQDVGLQGERIMRTRGVKLLDPVLHTDQLDWLFIPVRDCPDATAERQIAACHFRVPHEPWGPYRAFVLPVIVRRSRRRVLFCQRSGREP